MDSSGSSAFGLSKAGGDGRWPPFPARARPPQKGAEGACAVSEGHLHWPRLLTHQGGRDGTGHCQVGSRHGDRKPPSRVPRACTPRERGCARHGDGWAGR